MVVSSKWRSSSGIVVGCTIVAIISLLFLLVDFSHCKIDYDREELLDILKVLKERKRQQFGNEIVDDEKFAAVGQVTKLKNNRLTIWRNISVICGEGYEPLEVSVESTQTYISCFDPVHSKIPLFTLHSILYSDKTEPRPDVEPWYMYFDQASVGNGRSIADGYDRGHLTPSADFNSGELFMKSSFYVFNRAPQVGNFNRNTWKNLETIVRQLNVELKKKNPSSVIKVFTGCSSTHSEEKTHINENNNGALLMIPKYYYKIVFYLLDDTTSFALLFFGLNVQNGNSVKIVADASQISTIPAEIEKDLMTLQIRDVLTNKNNGLLLKNGKNVLYSMIPDVEKKLTQK